jgi:hypothetical protein
MPWNDFRTPVGPISQFYQVVFHQIILLLGALGASLGLLFSREKNGLQRKILARSFVAAVFAFHFIYVAFITVPRYALTAMPEVILFAAAGVRIIFGSGYDRETKRRLHMLLLAGIAFFAIVKIDWAQELMAVSGGNQALVWVWIGSIIKLAATLLLLFACLSAQQKILRFSGKAVCVAVVLFLAAAPSLCLPLRVHGRWYECQESLGSCGDSGGKKIIETIEFSEPEIEALKTHQAYVAVNLANGINLSDELKISVNGVCLDGPYIPAMAFAQDLTTFQHPWDGTMMYEVESVVYALAVSAGISNLDLRQWYLIPLTPSQIDRVLNQGEVVGKSPGQRIRKNLSIEIKKGKAGSNTIFGAYKSNDKFIFMPSLTRYSWEKAFYGVENDRGLTDPSYDLKVSQLATSGNNYSAKGGPEVRSRQDACAPRSYAVGSVASGSWSMKKDSPALPASRSMDYYLHILTAPKVVNGDRYIKLLASYNYPTLSVEEGGAQIKTIPLQACSQPNRDSLWLIRISGKTENNFKARSEIGIEEVGQMKNGRRLSYRSPWLPRELPSKTSFDYCFPIMPAAFPGRLEALVVHLGPVLTSTSEKKDAAMLKAKNDKPKLNRLTYFDQVQLRVYQLPNVPTGLGYEIY